MVLCILASLLLCDKNINADAEFFDRINRIWEWVKDGYLMCDLKNTPYV